MRIGDLDSAPAGDRIRLSATFDFDAAGLSPERVWVEVPGDLEPEAALRLDSFAVFALPLSGVLGEPIRSRWPISQVLLHNLNEAAGVYASYFPRRFRRMPVELEAEARSRGGGEWASFFSGGVDSLYNVAETDWRAARHQGQPLDRLWLVHGFDIRLAQEALWETTRRSLEDACAKTLPQRFEILRTNVRELYDSRLSWPQLGFGAALGGVAKVFAPRVSRVLVASYGTYDQVIPHSSSPLVDPCWSCDEQDLVHFSCLATRLDKLRRIGERPELLEQLRVCWRSQGALNCGRCEKCLRTRVQLALLGLEDACASMPGEIDLDALAAIELPWKRAEAYVWSFWSEIEREARGRPELEEVWRATRRMLRRNRPRLLRRLLKSG